MRVVLHNETRDDTIDGATTGPDGMAHINFKVGHASSGFEVKVDVIFLVDGQEVMTAQTSYTPKGK